jgi:hypothetical protein
LFIDVDDDEGDDDDDNTNTVCVHKPVFFHVKATGLYSYRCSLDELANEISQE